MERIERQTQAYSQAPWRGQLQVLGIFLLILVMFGLVAGIYLNITARADTIGREIQDMQATIEVQERVNEDLRAKLAFISSSSEMEKRAERMGFRPIESGQAVYILVPGYTSRQAVVIAPTYEQATAPSRETPNEYTESIFSWLERKIKQWVSADLEVKP